MQLLMALALAQALGDLTHFGNKWGWTGTNEAFVPQLVMYATPPHFYGKPEKVDRDIQTFLVEHGFHGFHVFMACRWFDLHATDCRDIEGKDPELDPRTFDALEMLIRKTYRAGGMVHLWMWGDEERGQTPAVRRSWGGLDGPVARKVEKAIAERLGPLPGWSLGYGFDLDEWVSAPEIHRWRDRMQARLPRFHFLGGRPAGPNRGRDHGEFARWNRGLDYASYEHHRPDYAVYVAALEANPSRPVMSEDRFRVLRGHSKHYSVQDVRRGLWHSTLAGGVANIWGYLMEGGSHELGSAPFPNRGQVRTYFEFVRDRFRKDMERCSPPRANPGRKSLCLGSASREHYLFYRENAERVELDLRAMKGKKPVTAVDARRPHVEIDVGELEPAVHTWQAPRISDWALAVGHFDRTAGVITDSAPIAPTSLSLHAAPQGTIELRWRHDGEASGFEVERASSSMRFENVATLEGGRRSFADRNVRRDTTSWYRVRALRGEAASDYSETSQVFLGRDATVVTNLEPEGYRVSRLREGDRHYLDRDYRLDSLPALLRGAYFIRTRNDDKVSSSEEFLSFEINRDAVVYVAFDRRARRLPRWLGDWERVDERIQVGRDMGYFELFRKEFSEGRVMLGGTSSPGADFAGRGRSHYIVAILPR